MIRIRFRINHANADPDPGRPTPTKDLKKLHIVLGVGYFISGMEASREACKSFSKIKKKHSIGIVLCIFF
jgi:hypothetical protein